jgi:hypothetical protein
MKKVVSLAALLIGTATPAVSQGPVPETLVIVGMLLASSNALIVGSYSGGILYKGEGYDVTATVDRGVVMCSGTFRSGGETLPIQGRGKLDLELSINANEEYQFALHCPYPTGYNEGMQELAHSYKRPGGRVTIDPATCDERGRPMPGHSGPCKLKLPEELKGGWSDPETGSVTWALCQHHGGSYRNVAYGCSLPSPPPPPPPPQQE